MNTGQSLEAERQSILDRMQMRRESYRRMLTGGPDIDQISEAQPLDQPVALPHTRATQSNHEPAYRLAPDHFPRSTIMRTITEHPYLCALGVAAVVLIGPRRIVRTVVNAGTTATALAAGNQTNADLLGKVLAMAGAYVQGRADNSTHH